MEKKMTVKRISAIENGKADVTVSELLALSKVLNVHPYTLLCPEAIKDGDLHLLDNFVKILTAKERGPRFSGIKTLIQKEAGVTV